MFLIETIENASYLFLVVLTFLLLFALRNQLKSQVQTSKRLDKICKELTKANQLLSGIAGIELQQDYQSSDTKVYVGNLNHSSTESDLAQLFSKFGQIEFINIPINKHNGKNRGYGFVTFKTSNIAEKAIQLNGVEFKGRQLQVNFAKERV